MITSAKLMASVQQAGLGRAMMRVADGNYGVPALSYVCEDFPKWWQTKLDERGLGEWTPQFDCDDFAWTLYTDIRWAHYATQKSNAEGISLGVMYYNARVRAEGGSGGGHAINVLYTEHNGEDRVFFIEPQLAARGKSPLIELSKQERESCWFVNF